MEIMCFRPTHFTHERGPGLRSRADIQCIRLRIVSRNFFIFEKRGEFADKASQVADSRFPSCRFQVFIGLASFRSLFQGFWSNKTGKMYISARSTILQFRIKKKTSPTKHYWKILYSLYGVGGMAEPFNNPYIPVWGLRWCHCCDVYYCCANWGRLRSVLPWHGMAMAMPWSWQCHGHGLAMAWPLQLPCHGHARAMSWPLP